MFWERAGQPKFQFCIVALPYRVLAVLETCICMLASVHMVAGTSMKFRFVDKVRNCLRQTVEPILHVLGLRFMGVVPYCVLAVSISALTPFVMQNLTLF